MRFLYQVAYLLLSAFVFYATVSALQARSWDDLDEDNQIYGSEKEKKFPIQAIVIRQEKWEGHHSLMLFWLFRHRDYPKYRSQYLIPLYSLLHSKVDERYRWQALNVLRVHDLDEDEFYVLPVFADRQSRRSRTQWFLPLYWYKSRWLPDGTESYTHFSLFHIRHSSQAGIDNGFDDDIVAAPLLPLFYYRARNHGLHLNLFWGFDYAKYENAGRFMVFPFWSSYSDSGYQHLLFPVYFYGRDGDSTTVNLLLLNHYTFSQSNLRLFWLAPVLFWKQNRYLYILPFYFHHAGKKTQRNGGLGWYKYDGEKERIRYYVLWYSRVSNPPKKQSLKILFPFYLDYQSNQKLNMLLPLYVTYADSFRYVHFNLSGFSFSENKGFLPVSAGRENKSWYIETDTSWLYNFFSLRLRYSFLNEKEPNASAEPNQARDKSGNKLSFWSVTFLYGLYHAQRKDDEYHFRALPLAWITWNKKNSDKVIATPFFFKYHEKDKEYFATLPLPLYGSYRKKDESFTAYGIFLYWNYASPREEESFVFPFYYAQNAGTPNRHAYKQWIFPWYTSRSRSQTDEQEYTNFLFLYEAGFVQNTGSDTNSSALEFEKISWLFSLFSYTHYAVENLRKWSIAYSLLFSYELHEHYSKLKVGLIYGHESHRYGYEDYLFPIYWYQKSASCTSHLNSPLLMYRRSCPDHGSNLIGLGALWYNHWKGDSTLAQYLLIGTLWYRSKIPQREYDGFGSLWGWLWQYQTERETGWSKFSILKFIFSRTRKEDNIQYRILGFSI